ncbi:MAG: peptidase, partial [Lysobacterales bacterium]
MFRLSSALRVLGVFLLVTGLLVCLGGAGLYWYLAPKLPSIESLKDIQLQEPLRVYSKDGRLIAEFGEKRRTPLKFVQIQPLMVKAVLAAEDERFYQHPGVDWQGLARAVVHVIRTGEKGPGGSTITMQVARNFFLGREKTYLRKINEILLALKIEKELTKDDILELYFNKIFLGHRAYGVEAAALVYYGSSLDELSVAQTAMIAGLPKAPSRFNPIVNPERAMARRNYVLG